MKILLLEDDIMLNVAITHYLTTLKHSVTPQRDGEECLCVAKNEQFDLCIFDINVPSRNGLSILEELHVCKKAVPVIYISTLIDIEDISRAYELGCCDYIKKPFHLKELNFKINQIVQRAKKDMHHKRLSQQYSYDCDSLTLYYGDIPQILSKRQLQIIQYLAHNRSFVCSYDMFREFVWSDDAIDDATIRAEINRLKKNLKEDFITNIRGIGYTIRL
ncbi:MAG: response regulator transcription factor [Sulfurospirillum sp.]|nr:response regulator transcription factor [Sulfurospirillum sp.]